MIEELDILRPLILSPKDYLDLRPKFGDFITFEVTEKHPALKDKLSHLQDHSRRHYRLAQEIAAAYHGRRLATIQADWKHFNPRSLGPVPAARKPVLSSDLPLLPHFTPANTPAKSPLKRG